VTPPADGQLFDGQGCLTASGLAAFQRAAPGRAPKEVAAHVAACARCQQRLLASLREPARTAPSRRASSGSRLVWMAALVIGALFVLLAGLVAAMRHLAH
jgi:hypothetical protein